MIHEEERTLQSLPSEVLVPSITLIDTVARLVAARRKREDSLISSDTSPLPLPVRLDDPESLDRFNFYYHYPAYDNDKEVIEDNTEVAEKRKRDNNLAKLTAMREVVPGLIRDPRAYLLGHADSVKPDLKQRTANLLAGFSDEALADRYSAAGELEAVGVLGSAVYDLDGKTFARLEANVASAHAALTLEEKRITPVRTRDTLLGGLVRRSLRRLPRRRTRP